MTEKRFTLIEDDLEPLILDNKETMSVNEVVNLLNELYEANEKLRQIMKDIVGATNETYTKNTSVFKVTVVLDFEKYNEIRRCI